ncbi:MAG: hypothetical protein ACR65R_11425 [Methylomicrobium sp.]
MSIKTRLDKLEAAVKSPFGIWLQITTEDGDSAEVIERLKAEAVKEWKQANPEREFPAEFNWIVRRIVEPKLPVH